MKRGNSHRLAYAVIAFPIFVALAIITAIVMPFTLFFEAIREED